MSAQVDLKNVELVRRSVIRVQQGAFRRLAYHLSVIEGQTEATDIVRKSVAPDTSERGIENVLRGESLIARVCELILAELGHSTAVTVENTDGRRRSKTLRAVKDLGA